MTCTMTDEDAWFADQAALLDPACYLYQNTPGWSLTVPPGETWYALNIWRTTVSDSPAELYHRRADTRAAVQLPAGFTLTANGASSFIYYARPILAQSDPRYQDDPRGLYYSRLRQLSKIPMKTVSVEIPIGTSVYPVVNDIYATFPAGFTSGIIRHVSSENGAWTTLLGPSAIINMLDEIDDSRPHRSAASILLPFQRAVFSQIKMQPGSIDRDFVNAGFAAGAETQFLGSGHVMFQPLPAGW